MAIKKPNSNDVPRILNTIFGISTHKEIPNMGRNKTAAINITNVPKQVTL